jgi:hypothetical protein
MSTNNDDILGLPPFLSEPGFGSELNQLAITDPGKSRGTLSAINNESFKQQIVIDVFSTKTRHGMHRDTEMGQTAMSEFNAIASYINTFNQAAHGTPYEAYLNAFTDRLMKTSAKHIFGMLEIGAANIAKEVYRPVKPNEPNGFIQKLLGSG